MSRILAIAANTMRESIRDRVLYSIVFFGVLLVALSLGLRELTVGDQEKVVRSMALGSIRLISSALAIFLGVSLVYKELQSRTIYTLVSKPIPRWLFLLGKYLGLMGVLVLEILLMGILYVTLMSVTQTFPPGAVFIGWLLLVGELAMLTAWTLLFSTYSSPMLATLFSVAVYVIGHLADDIWTFGQRAESEAVRELSEWLYWVLPNFDVFNVTNSAVHGLAVPMDRILLSAGYGGAYTLALLAGAVWIFQERDFH